MNILSCEHKKNPILLFINVHHREFIGAIVIIANWRLELIKGESNHITNRLSQKILMGAIIIQEIKGDEKKMQQQVTCLPNSGTHMTKVKRRIHFFQLK